MFRALWGNPGVQGKVLEIRPLEIKAEEFLDFSADLREVHYSNAPLSLGCEESLIQIIKRNYMVSPLSFQEKLFGAVLLADKDADFSGADHNLVKALQVSLALTLRNFYQCEGLLKIDELRREYCLELSRAVETTLDRIREEVQAIYSRLGRTASPQKKNCEAILFEVGKLMEVVKEVREFEPEGELELPPTKAETLNNPNSEREPTR